MNGIFKAAIVATGVLLLCTTSNAQTIDIGPNEYAFQFTGNPNFGLFFNQTDGRYEFLNGSADAVIGFNANTGNFTTNLGFESGSDLLIGNNRYAFRSAANPNFGLFFNAGPAEYQLLDGSASPVFSVNANTGNSILTGGIRLGNSNLAQAGNIRWNGSDFQGYTGSSWTTLTGGSVGPEGPAGPQGPQGPPGVAGESGFLPDGTPNAVPRYTGTTWDVTATGMTYDGTSVGIGGSPSNDRLYVTSLTNDAVAGASGIEAYRNGLSGSAGTLTSWFIADAAIRGRVNWGNSYSAAVYGSSFLDFENSAAVVGSNNPGTIFGALAYKTPTGRNVAGYFNGRVFIT
ncbi:MAG: hypothetical protein WBG42_17455, partial [Cryomorphaceae bacterium]